MDHRSELLLTGLVINVLLIVGFYLPFVEIELSRDFIRESFHTVESCWYVYKI